MKMKSIIKCGLLLLGLGTATVSCEDMFTAKNTLVSKELEPQDTLYQMMGIIKRMQKLADRTVLLGEVRADLVDVDPLHASLDIQELAANNVSATNVYNQPSDYYAVINSCNIYLNYVDSMRNSQGTRKYYEKEILSAKCYRAWCYLELLKIYGEVPYVRTPVLTSDDAQAIVASGKKEGLVKITTDMINDLITFRATENDDLRQEYANRSFNGIRYQAMSIPVRAMLAELYLWRASYTGDQNDYVNAIRMYHDYFTFPSEEINTGNNIAEWRSRDAERPSGNYDGNFRSSRNCAGVLPMETSKYYGTVSELRKIFCSLDSNNYYPAVTASQRAKDISKAQDYCQFITEGGGFPEVYYREHDENLYSDYKTMEGDLRLYSISDGPDNVKDNSTNSRENSSYNNMYYLNRKYGNTTNGNSYLEFIPFFRNNILYLHFAEALNRAGFPETAFAILKYGLSYYTLTNRSIISQDEFDRLCLITSLGFTVQEPKFADDDLKKQTTGTAVIWSSNVFGTYFIHSLSTMNPDARLVEGGSQIQLGIHSFGCGDTQYNEKYYLDDADTKKGLKTYVEDIELEEVPRLSRNSTHEDSVEYDRVIEYNAWADSVNIARKDSVDTYNASYLASTSIRTKRQARVAQLILEEEALEGVFEGLRFYDIMRYQMQEMGGSAIGSTITMPAYIEDKYGATTKMAGKPWYLKLPSR